MTKPAKPLPRFRTEAHERAFWETEGRASTQHLDWAKALDRKRACWSGSGAAAPVNRYSGLHPPCQQDPK